MSEEVKGVLEKFSPLLLQDYIRLMTAACYIKSENKTSGVRFKMLAEHYEKMRAEPLQAPLIGLTLDYDAAASVLTVTADEKFLALYENKIMNNVALQYFDVYGKRYENYISYQE